jgi:CheY-like chemotaxis protein
MVKLVIAEDNPFVVAMMREAVAEDPRYEICGIATSTPQLLGLGELHKPDLAVIDLRLADESSGIHAAVALSERIRVGILFATGHPQQVIDPPTPVGEACLTKPFTGPELIEALRIVEHLFTTGLAPALVPPKVHLIRRSTGRGLDEAADPEAWHPKLKRLYNYWLSIHPRVGLPGRQHFDPVTIPDLLAYLFLVDVERNPPRFKYRLVGTEYVRMMGRDLTGRYLDDVHPGFLGPIRDQYVRIAEHSQFAYRKGRVMFTATLRDHFIVERLALPLARNGIDVDMILGGIIHLRSI